MKKMPPRFVFEGTESDNTLRDSAWVSKRGFLYLFHDNGAIFAMDDHGHNINVKLITAWPSRFISDYSQGVVLTAEGFEDATYEWSTGVGARTITVFKTGLYSVTISRGGYHLTDSIVLKREF